MRNIHVILILMVSCFGVMPTSAGAPISVDSSTEITAPGEYVVTRDIDCGHTTKRTIIISGSHVTLDLQGFSITCFQGYNALLIRSQASDVTIMNGAVDGCCSSVPALESHGKGIHLKNLFVGEDYLPLEIVDSDTVEITNCTIEAYGVGPVIGRTKPGLDTGKIIGNTITGAQYVSAGGCTLSGGTISGNVFQGGVNRTGFAVQVPPGGAGNLVEGNVFNRYSTALQVVGNGNLVRKNVVTNDIGGEESISVSGDANVLIDNTVMNSDAGIEIIGGENRILNNHVSNGTNFYLAVPGGMLITGEGNVIAGNEVFMSPGAGIVLYRSQNILGGNNIHDNLGCAILELNGTSNVFNDNILQGNGTDGVCLF